MFDLPDSYKVDVSINLKDFIPKDLKPNDKKRIKDIVKTVKLENQIAGEEIPSVISEEYRCQVIQFYDIEVRNIKDAKYLVNIYQSRIKPLCVMRLYDTKDEMYSLALKRLSQADETQVIVEQNLITDKYMLGVPDGNREIFLQYMNFNQLKNKVDKVQIYREWFYKAYLIINEKAYLQTDKLLNGNSWYDPDRMKRLYQEYRNLVIARDSLKKASTNSERIKINKEIKSEIHILNSEVE